MKLPEWRHQGTNTYRWGESRLGRSGCFGLPSWRWRGDGISLNRMRQRRWRCLHFWLHGRHCGHHDGRSHDGLLGSRSSLLHMHGMGRKVGWRHDRLRVRIGRYDHRSIMRLLILWPRRWLHGMSIGRVPLAIWLVVRLGHVAIHVWRIPNVLRGAHVGRDRVVAKVLLPSGGRHRWLPMRHHRQVVVHFDRDGEICLDFRSRVISTESHARSQSS